MTTIPEITVTERQKTVFSVNGADFDKRDQALNFGAVRALLRLLSQSRETDAALEGFLAKIVDNADDVVAVLQRYIAVRDTPQP